MVEMTLVGDDCSLPVSSISKVGRRGLAGTVLVHKILGAQACLGAHLSDIVKTAEAIGSSLWTVGVSFSSCSIPAFVLLQLPPRPH
mmetsp:Transcript_42669/g.109885  ORF Transcript_42669/g.109885 Transcript_42669/m.109885 type:complete len:86 (+) Transcript_42669:704-961(+)